MFTKKLLILAFILALSLASNSVTEQPPNLDAVGQLTVKNVYPFIDYQLKQTWWQYLRGAKLVYRANVDHGDKFQFLSIYRNIVGTFLSITTWVKGAKNVRVDTLVRLGDGYDEGSGANYQGISLNPLALSFKLGDGEFFVDANQQGELQVNGEVITDHNNGFNEPEPAITELELKEKCAKLDQWIREHNWQYLRGAQNVHRSGRTTNERHYCVFNYVNIVGTFLVISSAERDSGRMLINTFVRLGNGFETDSGALYTPVDFEPIELNF